MTRKGKIARLPTDIREQINSRLENGEEGISILTWLNSLPEVQAVLAEVFDSRPVNEVNLSDWKQGGYRDWLVRQDALEFASDLQDKDSLGHKDLGQTSGATLVQWVAIQYAAAAKAIVSSELDPKIKWARLRELCADVTHLHRAELTAERVGHEGFWVDRQANKDHEQYLAKVRAEELWVRTVKEHKELFAAEAAAKAALPVEEEEDEDDEDETDDEG